MYVGFAKGHRFNECKLIWIPSIAVVNNASPFPLSIYLDLSVCEESSKKKKLLPFAYTRTHTTTLPPLSTIATIQVTGHSES